MGKFSKASLNCMVNTGDNTAYPLTNAGDWSVDNVQTFYYDWFYPRYYGEIRVEKSKTEQAFKIVGVLLEKKIIKGTLTVKTFIGLVNEISLVL